MPIKDFSTEGSPDPLYDVCVIGSGPAGLTLCAELAASGRRVCVLESGLERKSKHADSLREVQSQGEIIIRSSSRERVLGGTSTTWAGLSAPLDPIDFERWPMTYSDLEPYYSRAGAYGFPALDSFKLSTMEHLRDSDDFSRTFSRLQEKIFIAGDPPWNFGKKLRHLFDLPNIDLYFDATVTKLLTQNDKVSEAVILTSKGVRKKIRARYFVLATGGIENTRLLLASNIGNEHGQVGKYLTNHPKGFFGVIKLNKKIKNLPHFFGFLHKGMSRYIGLRLSENIQREHHLLNSYLRFEPVFPWTDNRGVEALVLLVKKAKFFLDWWKRRQKKMVTIRDWNETGDDAATLSMQKNWLLLIPDVLLHLPAVISYSFYRLFPQKEIGIKSIRIRNFMDMEPSEENRITLSNENIPVIKMRTSKKDRDSLIYLHKVLREELEKNSIGKLEGDLSKAAVWPITADASHHLGGTIMGNEGTRSVVNKDLKVHSLDNTYVIGGSVFPSAGCANPTFTICALSIRLADTLKKIL